MPKFKMVMFDLDGTLLDSFSFHAKSLQRFLRSFDVRISQEKVGGMIGDTLKSILSSTMPQKKHAEALKKLADFYRYEADDLIEELRFIAGAEETVLRAKEKTEYTALLTNSKKELVYKIIEIKQWDGMFDMVKAADDHSLGKVRRCMDILDAFSLKPQDVLYVGDSVYDIVLAKDIGMYGCLVLNDISWIHKQDWDPNEIQADFTVSQITEVLDLL
ncbi:MAG: HAD hydrolase-like protein [Eubacteriales bacterium]